MEDKKIKFQIICFLFFFLLSGCISENTDDCSQGTFLKFRYVLNPANEDLFSSSVDVVTVYVFDSEKKFVTMKVDSGYNLSGGNIMKLNLPDGRYDIVAIGGDLADYHIGTFDSTAEEFFKSGLEPFITSLNDFRLKVVSVRQGTLFPDSLKDLFVGMIENVEVRSGKEFNYMIDFTKNTNRVELRVLGLEHMEYTPVLSADNGRYNYRNAIPNDALERIYVPLSSNTRSEGKIFTYNILRLMEDRWVSLHFLDNRGNNIIPEFEGLNIIEEIMKSPKYNQQMDLDREDYYEIELKFDGLTLVSMKINGWEIISINPEV